MRFIVIKMLLTSTIIALVTLPSSVVANEVTTNITAASEDALEARSLVKAFGSDLKSVLISTMKTEGPIQALAVCNIEAGPIAQKHSALANWNIARTALKVRNTNNTPDAWELAVLTQFEKRKAAGENVATMEYSETISLGEKSVYRYMKPIPTAGACLACHGEVLSENVANKINILYPDDQATGFSVGDIRGAFSLQKISD